LGRMNSGVTGRGEGNFIQPHAPFTAVDWVAKLEAYGVEAALVDVGHRDHE
jgi:hypothetical protein